MFRIALVVAMQSPVFTLPAGPLPPDVPPSVSSPCPDSIVAPIALDRIERGTTRPQVRTHRVPQGTPEFYQTGADAKVWVTLVVDVDGRPCDLRVVRSTYPDVGLEASSVAAATKWEFTPAKKDGIPVRSTMTIAFGFQASRHKSSTPGRHAGKVVDVEARQVPAPLLQDSRPRSSQTTPP